MNCKREYRDTNCEATPPLVPQLQLNLHHKSTDQGALADTTDTAGTVLSVRPGLTVPALKHMHISVRSMAIRSFRTGPRAWEQAMRFERRR
jgi:histidyl-tRNA synthetase